MANTVALRHRVQAANAFGEAVANELWTAGFTQRKRGLFTAPVAHGILAWVGLNRAITDSGPVEINPVVGVRHQELERLLARLEERAWHQFSPPTVSIHLGYLLPDPTYSPVTFAPDDEKTPIAADLARSIERHALRFARENAALEALAGTLSKPRFSELRGPYRLVAALLLLGRLEDASELVARQLASYEGARHRAAADFRRFAVAVRARMSEMRKERKGL